MRFEALLVLLPLMVPLPAAAQSINQRPATGTAIIAGSRGRYDGTFTGSGTASVCGEIPREASLTGVATFVVEYPYDDPGAAPLQSIAFGSKQLVGKDTVSTAFTLNVHVRTADGGRPPAYVLNTDGGNGKDRGTATLSRKKSTLTLTVRGSNDMGETIELVLVCQ
jgi:hypothetical protein